MNRRGFVGKIVAFIGMFSFANIFAKRTIATEQSNLILGAQPFKRISKIINTDDGPKRMIDTWGHFYSDLKHPYVKGLRPPRQGTRRISIDFNAISRNGNMVLFNYHVKDIGNYIKIES